MFTAKKALFSGLVLLSICLTSSSAQAQNEYGRDAWMASFRTLNDAYTYRNSRSGVHRAMYTHATTSYYNVVNAIERPTRTNWYYATLWSYYTYYYAWHAANQDLQRGYYLVPPKSVQVRDNALKMFQACLRYYQNG